MAITKERKEEVLATYQGLVQAQSGRHPGGIYRRQDEGHGQHPRQDPRNPERSSMSSRTPWRAASSRTQGMSLPDELSAAVHGGLVCIHRSRRDRQSALADATKGMEFVKVKGGFMAGQLLSASQVKALVRTAATARRPRTVAGRSAGACLANWSARLQNRRARWLPSSAPIPKKSRPRPDA